MSNRAQTLRERTNTYLAKVEAERLAREARDRQEKEDLRKRVDGYIVKFYNGELVSRMTSAANRGESEVSIIAEDISASVFDEYMTQKITSMCKLDGITVSRSGNVLVLAW